MKTFLFAMSDMDHDHRSWKGFSNCAALTILTLTFNALCREQAALVKETVGIDSNDKNNPVKVSKETAVEVEHILLLFPLAITIGQLLTAAGTLLAQTPKGEYPNREALAIVVFSQAGFLFLHTYLSFLGDFTGPLAAGYSEPLLSLLAFWLVTSLPGTLNSWVGIWFICLGSTFLSLNWSAILLTNRTSLILGLSVFAGVLRNIIIRHLSQVENVVVKTRGSQVMVGFFVSCGCIIAMAYLLLSPLWIGLVMIALTSMGLATAMFYVTAKLLKTGSIVTVALVHIISHFLESMYMTPLKYRPDWILGVIAACIVGLGIYLYLKEAFESKVSLGSGLGHYRKPVSSNEQYTRMEFLLFSCMVIGVIFYVFQPKLSQRDLTTLSYVGLDKVLRRLLSTG